MFRFAKNNLKNVMLLSDKLVKRQKREELLYGAPPYMSSFLITLTLPFQLWAERPNSFFLSLYYATKSSGLPITLLQLHLSYLASNHPMPAESPLEERSIDITKSASCLPSLAARLFLFSDRRFHANKHFSICQIKPALLYICNKEQIPVYYV